MITGPGLGLDWLEQFGDWANLSVSVAVTVFGLYWLGEFRRRERPSFIYRTYAYWWASWFAWVLAWTVLLLRARKVFDNYFSDLQIDTAVLLLDNLNTLCLLLVFLSLIRGRDYTVRRARIDFVRLAVSLGLAYYCIYFTVGFLNHNMLLAYTLHMTWSQALGVFSPIIVGWAVSLRFGTRRALMVGFVYGFMQPIVYATQFLANEDAHFAQTLAMIRPLIAMVLAFMKVVWAIVCTKILWCLPCGDQDLVPKEPSLLQPLDKRWQQGVTVHALSLIVVYVGMLVILVRKYLATRYAESLTSLAFALGVIASFVGILQFFWWIWDKMNRDKS